MIKSFVNSSSSGKNFFCYGNHRFSGHHRAMSWFPAHKVSRTKKASGILDELLDNTMYEFGCIR